MLCGAEGVYNKKKKYHNSGKHQPKLQLYIQFWPKTYQVASIFCLLKTIISARYGLKLFRPYYGKPGPPVRADMAQNVSSVNFDRCISRYYRWSPHVSINPLFSQNISTNSLYACQTIDCSSSDPCRRCAGFVRVVRRRRSAPAA